MPATAVILFVRGRQIPIETLRRGYTEILDRFGRKIEQIAHQQRAQLNVPAEILTDPAEMAEARFAKQLGASSETRELRDHIGQRGLGVQTTLEVFSAVMLQIFTSGHTNEDDLEAVQRRLNLPTIAVPPPNAPWLPTDARFLEQASIAAMKRIIASATLEDFESARLGAITLNKALYTPEGMNVAARLGLTDSVEWVQKIAGENQLALDVLTPLMLRVGFGMDPVEVAALLFPNTVLEDK